MAGPSEENKVIARMLLAAVGGNPRVMEYRDEGEQNCIDLMIVPDRPVPGVTTIASIGLSDTTLRLRGEEYPTSVEILGCSNSRVEFFPNVISTVAFYVIKNGWFCAPGVIYPDIVSMYYPGSPMKHMYFTAPFIWENSLITTELNSKTVSFLLVIPISEQERQYAVENGPLEMERQLERIGIDTFDFFRESAL